MRIIMSDIIIVGTDGGCRPNPGVGGIGCVIKYKHLTKEISDAFTLTTNNRMEIMSVIYALRFLNSKKIYQKCNKIQLFSDSKYVINTFEQKWINVWATNHWKNGTVKNIDLWKQLLEEIQFYDVSWQWIKSHKDHEINNRCDELATAAIKSGIYKIDVGY
jgi:ribonuclease HI